MSGFAFTDAEMAEHRADALEVMPSRATVCRMTGDTVTVDGFEVDEYAPVVADSAFKLAGVPRSAASSRNVTLGNGVGVQLGLRVGKWPVDTPRLQDGDVVKVTEGENADSFWRVIEGDFQDAGSSYRVPLIATTEPAGWPADES